PGTLDVWMANPLSAVPTPFLAEVGGRTWYGNCAWDAPGIVAMLGANGRVETACPDCGDRLEMTIRGRDLEPIEAVGHFAIPARKWWDDIGFT
ncbi:MAG TPA: organomercurial lyase, partial [Actinomycetota bacterium]|nr:organomercurial lyase [Actinomycetota bacterium]